MLILIGVVPATYALNLATSSANLQSIVAASQAAQPIFGPAPSSTDAMASQVADAELSRFLTTGKPTPQTMTSLAVKNGAIAATLGPIKSISELPVDGRSRLRRDVYLVEEGVSKLTKAGAVPDAKNKATLSKLRSELQNLTDFIPLWVKIAVAVALGLGTTIGWKRIVVTVGEKIGKSHLTYAQGASAEMVAMLTIGAADMYGLPVSTTHILSSGIAGTMAANRSGLQKETMRNILLAWVFTLPACMILGSVLFAAGLFVVLRLF
jgi:PiT family inorganic phosphate transporter